MNEPFIVPKDITHDLFSFGAVMYAMDIFQVHDFTFILILN